MNRDTKNEIPIFIPDEGTVSPGRSSSKGLSASFMKRSFDVALAVTSMIVTLPLMLFIALMIAVTSKGPVLHWSKRVGRKNGIFRMPKFRTMKVETPQVATHLLMNPSDFLTPVGKVLRKTSLDELPQFLSILMGQMSFVGPRPALFNQHDLILLRTERGIDELRPGLTGWAQINGRDELPIPVKVQFDYEYLLRQSFWFDLRIIARTVIKMLRADGITH